MGDLVLGVDSSTTASKVIAGDRASTAAGEGGLRADLARVAAGA